VIDLPFPPSTNRLWRHYRRRIVPSPEYQAWIKQADGLAMFQKVGRLAGKIDGPFFADFALSKTYRMNRGRRRDVDNCLKAALDWAERVGLIRDDADCEGGTFKWCAAQDAPEGLRLTLSVQELQERDDENRDHPFERRHPTTPE
jgi:Holliday junction resolvase RusA-like endonuclease